MFRPARFDQSNSSRAEGTGYGTVPEIIDGEPHVPDILNVLKAEHNALRKLFKELDGTTDRAVKKRAQLLQEIEANLLPHAKWEETVFYPAFAERASHDGLKTHAEAVEEHRVVEKMVVPDVKGADPGTREFAGNAKVFADLIDHHAKEEETTMFAEARKLFSAEERAQLAEEYAQWKETPAALALVAASKGKTAMKGALR
jgi:hemerythrin-like domain-containing protein